MAAHPANAIQSVGLIDWIGRRPVATGQILLVMLLALALLLDGVDLKILAYFAPVIIGDWQVSEVEFGPALSAALVGMAIGSGVGGWIGDRFGPRRTAIACVLLFGIGTLACAYAPNLLMLILLRFISGMGFGGLNPNAFALLADWLPRRVFPTAVAILATCTPFGGVVGAGVALVAAPIVGWRGCFEIVGVASLLLAAGMIWLPESWTYLNRAGKRDAIPSLINRLFAKPDQPSLHYGPSDHVKHVDAGSIFESQIIRFTMGTAFCYFVANVVTYGFNSWLYVALTAAGVDFRVAVQTGIAFNSVSMAVCLLTGWLTQRFGSKAVLITAATLATVVTMWLGGLLYVSAPGSAPHQWQIYAATGLAGGSTGCVLSTLTIIMTAGFPAGKRATGVGFGIMAGRVGAILVTLAGGALLTWTGADATSLFVALAVLALFIILAALIIDRHVGYRANQNI